MWVSMSVVGVTNLGCRYSLRHPRIAAGTTVDLGYTVTESAGVLGP
jgi:hypothetical protein